MTSHATIPADALYWAILDISALPPASGAKRREQLGFLFERFLPQPIEQIQAAYLAISDDTILACGIDRDRLAEVDAITLTADALPTYIADRLQAPGEVTRSHEPPGEEAPSLAIERLNLLTGAFEPPRIRALRRRWLAQLAAAAAIALAFLLFGVERRVQSARATAHTASLAIADAHRQALGPGSGPQFSRMTSELRRLRQTRSADAALMPADPTPALASWLAAWPADPPVQTQSIVASDTALTITTSAASNDDAQSLIDTLHPPAGWSLAQPSLSSTSDGVRLTLRAQPEPGP